MTKEELLKMGGEVITPTIQPIKMTKEQLMSAGGVSLTQPITPETPIDNFVNNASVGQVKGLLSNPIAKYVLGGTTLLSQEVTKKAPKIIKNTISDAWNMVKGLTYGTVKNIISIPKETIGLIKESGGAKKASELLKKEVLPTGVKLLWNLVPQSAKELSNIQSITELPKEFQSLVKESGGYSKALKTFIDTVPESAPKALKNYTNQIGKAISSFEEHPLNETLGYLALKDLATMTPEKLNQRVEFTKQSFKDVFSDISKGKVVPTEIQTMVNTAKTKITQKAVSNVEEDWNKIFKSTKSGVKKLEKGEITGKDPAKFLSERKITPKVEGTKINPDEAIDKIENEMKPLNEMTNRILETRPEKISFDTLESQTLSKINTPSNRANPDYSNMKQSVKTEFDNYRQTYGDSISLDQLNDIKIAQTRASGVFDMTKPKFQSNVNYQIGKVARETIENTVGDTFNMKGLQSLVGDHLDAIKMLESVRGQTVAYGRLGKLGGTIAGVATGKTLLGKLAGGVMGNYVVNVLTDLTISNPLKAMILKYAQFEDPVAYTEALNYLKNQGISQITTKALPQPSAIYGEEYKGGESKLYSQEEIQSNLRQKGVAEEAISGIDKQVNVFQKNLIPQLNYYSKEAGNIVSKIDFSKVKNLNQAVQITKSALGNLAKNPSIIQSINNWIKSAKMIK
ncbi:MAG: hypothetical protein WC549_04675 [Actinomycetota bacterium]